MCRFCICTCSVLTQYTQNMCTCSVLTQYTQNMCIYYKLSKSSSLHIISTKQVGHHILYAPNRNLNTFLVLWIPNLNFSHPYYIVHSTHTPESKVFYRMRLNLLTLFTAQKLIKKLIFPLAILYTL